MPLGRKPFCRKKNRIRQQKSKIQLAGGKIKKEKNKLEITENYSIGKKIRKRSGTMVESCQLFSWKKRKTKKNQKSPRIRLADYKLKTNQETEVTVD